MFWTEGVCGAGVLVRFCASSCVVMWEIVWSEISAWDEPHSRLGCSSVCSSATTKGGESCFQQASDIGWSAHTHICRTHIFLSHSLSAHIFMHVCTHGSSVMKKVFVHASLISPSRHLPSHDSPVSAVLARPLRDQSRLRLHWRLHPHDLAVLSRPESAGHAPLRACIGKFGNFAKSGANHRLWAQGVRQAHFRGWWHDAQQRSEPQFLRLLETTNENIRQIGVLTVFKFSVSQRFSWWFRSLDRKQRKHAIGKPLVDREIEEREGFVISAAESMSKKSQRNRIGCYPLQIHRKSFSEESFWRVAQKFFWLMTSPRISSTKSPTSYSWWRFRSEKIKFDWV